LRRKSFGRLSRKNETNCTVIAQSAHNAHLKLKGLLLQGERDRIMGAPLPPEDFLRQGSPTLARHACGFRLQPTTGRLKCPHVSTAPFPPDSRPSAPSSLARAHIILPPQDFEKGWRSARSSNRAKGRRPAVPLYVLRFALR